MQEMQNAKKNPWEIEIPELNFVKNNQIYIYGYFDDTIMTKVIPEFQDLISKQSEVKNGEIKININSNGGYIYILKNMLSLVESAKVLDITVSTTCFSDAFSCASILAASGSVGSRTVGEFTSHLLHLGATHLTAHTDKQLEREVDMSKRHFDFIRTMYKRYAKVKNLERAIKDDRYFITGKDIIENGLADNIVYLKRR